MNTINDIIDEIEKFSNNNTKALAYAHIVIHLMELRETMGFNPNPSEFVQAINNILDADFKKHIDNFIKCFNNKHRQLIIKNETDE